MLPPRFCLQSRGGGGRGGAKWWWNRVYLDWVAYADHSVRSLLITHIHTFGQNSYVHTSLPTLLSPTCCTGHFE